MQNAIWGLFLLAFAYDYFTLYKETINDSTEPRSVKESKEEIKNKDPITRNRNGSQQRKQSTMGKKLNDRVKINIYFW